MKLGERISWLMGYVQKTLLPHPDECLDIPLAKHEQHLAAILEIAEANMLSVGQQPNGLAVNCSHGKLLPGRMLPKHFADIRQPGI